MKNKYEEKFKQLKDDSDTKNVNVDELDNLKKELDVKKNRINELETFQQAAAARPTGAKKECSICCEEVTYIFQNEDQESKSNIRSTLPIYLFVPFKIVVIPIADHAWRDFKGPVTNALRVVQPFPDIYKFIM